MLRHYFPPLSLAFQNCPVATCDVATENSTAAQKAFFSIDECWQDTVIMVCDSIYFEFLIHGRFILDFPWADLKISDVITILGQAGTHGRNTTAHIRWVTKRGSKPRSLKILQVCPSGVIPIGLNMNIKRLSGLTFKLWHINNSNTARTWRTFSCGVNPADMAEPEHECHFWNCFSELVMLWWFTSCSDLVFPNSVTEQD